MKHFQIVVYEASFGPLLLSTVTPAYPRSMLLSNSRSQNEDKIGHQVHPYGRGREIILLLKATMLLFIIAI